MNSIGLQQADLSEAACEVIHLYYVVPDKVIWVAQASDRQLLF
ncbi:MAG: hypothetical protein SPF57_02870 [Streptococcus orisratti]|nr:hypothetical protein [Streptococcus orisratti]